MLSTMVNSFFSRARGGLVRRSVDALGPSSFVGLVGVAMFSLLAESPARAGNCPVPECVPGEIIGAGTTIPSNSQGVAYRATVGKYVHSSPQSGLDDAGDPIPPRYYSANAEILDDTGNPVPSSLDDDLADPGFKVLKPAGGLRPDRTYKVRFDKQCATGNTQPPPETVEIKTGPVAPKPTKVGTLEILEKRVATLDVPNLEDGGACTVKKEVSAVKIRFKPAPELVPFAKTLGYRASLDGEESSPLKYQVGAADGSYETEVYVACPTSERSVKAEMLVRILGESVNAPAASADVTILPCGGGASADAGGDGGNRAAAASGCSCDTTQEGSGTAGLSFALGAMATAMFVRTLARKSAKGRAKG